MQVETAALVLSYACDKFDWMQAKIKSYPPDKINFLTSSWAEVLDSMELNDCKAAIDEFYEEPDHRNFPKGIDQFPARIRAVAKQYARQRDMARHGEDRYKCPICRDTHHVIVMEFRPKYQELYDGLGIASSVAIACPCAPNKDNEPRLKYREGMYEIATYWTELREQLWWQRENQPEKYREALLNLKKVAGPKVKALFAELKARIKMAEVSEAAHADS